MYNLDYYMSVYLILMSCFMFGFYYKHLILMIISLEFIVVFISYNMYLIIMVLESMTFMLMFFLVFSVCEGALVLSLVVLMVRLNGNDYINSLSLLKW